MTVLIQSALSKGSGDTTASVTLAALPEKGNSVLVLISGTGPINSTAFEVADNQTGNTYETVALATSGGDGRTAQVSWLPSVAGRSGTYTVTVTAPSGQLLTDVVVAEVWGLSSVDQFAVTNAAESNATSLSLTNPSGNSGAADFVAAVFSGGSDGNTAIGLQTPSGYTSLDLNDPGTVGDPISICYKINSQSETDSVTWDWTTATGAGAAILVSFVGVPGSPYETLVQWNVGSSDGVYRRVVQGPAALAGPDPEAPPMPAAWPVPSGVLLEVFPVTAGSGGSLTINDDAGVVFTIAAADVTAGLPIKVNKSCAGFLGVDEVPSGGEYGISWQGLDGFGMQQGR